MDLSFQALRDFFFFPLRCLFPNNEYIHFLKVTPLSDLRLHAVWPLLRGRVLDLGCGDNRLIREYIKKGGSGIGVDLPSNRDCDVSIIPGQAFPFQDRSFDTITIVASLNHIPDRERILKECARCLNIEGRMIITMLAPLTGRIGHFIWCLLGSDADLKHRQPASGERPGLSKAEMQRLLHQAGFQYIHYRSFALGLNTLYLASKTQR
jgi:ubiquinone/menaquinone biosynthesis C-methylase UbiE